MSLTGAITALQQRPTPYQIAQPPAFEVNMDMLAAETLAILKECASLIDSASVTAIAITAQGDGVWPLDAAWQPAGPALIWRDGRSNSVLRRWRSEGRLMAAAEWTGTCPTSAHQTTQMAWLKAFLPERVAPIRHLVFAEDWIGRVMTGQSGVSAANFEHTYGHARPPDHDFWRSAARVLSQLGLDWMKDLLLEPKPPLKPRGTLLNSVAERIGLQAGIPVYVGPFDVLAAAIGAGAILPAQGSSVWGTAAIHQRWVRVFSPSQSGYLVSHPQAPGRWLRFIATSAGMVNLDYWRPILFPEIQTSEEWTRLESMLEGRLSGADGLIYLPYLSSADERSEPGPGILGAGFLGAQTHHQRADYLRAVYEGLAIQAARIFQRLDGFDMPLQEARIAGGGSHSGLLGRLLAHTTGLRVIQPAQTEASLLGAAIVAWVGLGYASEIDALSQAICPARIIYEPDPRLVRRYREMTATVENLVGRLNAA